MNGRSYIKMIGALVLILGILLLLGGVLLLALAASSFGFGLVVASVILNIIGITMLTMKLGD